MRWGEGLFEVAEAVPLPDGGMRYRLEEWRAEHVIRVIESYDAPTETARAGEHDSRSSSLARRHTAILLSPLLGHLPGDVQHRMETEFDAPARFMTIVSSAPLFVVGFLGLLGAFLGSVGGGSLFSGMPPRGISLYLVVESAIRIGSAWIQGQPMGSLAGVLIYHGVALARGTRSEAPEAPERPFREIPPPEGEDPGLDRYRMLEALLSLLTEEEQERLEIRFSFEALRWGRLSVLVLLAVGGLNAFASLAAFAGGVGGPVDAFWLAAGGALTYEQLVRRSSLARGKPRGSVLGGLVRPFARPLLTPRPPAGA